MRKCISFLFMMLFVITSFAQSAKQQIEQNILKSASNYYAYPVDEVPSKYTKAPNGYTPFHIEHYGRHGSRWLMSKKQFMSPIHQLEIAERNNKLTNKGEKVLAKLKEVYAASNNRLGELTELGAEQHKGIAKRMYTNFPEVFKDNAKIDARSSIVIRCILSMENALQEIKAYNPKLSIFHDASYADMYYMNFDDSIGKSLRRKVEKTVSEIKNRYIKPSRFTSQLISNSKFIKDSIDSKSLMADIFGIASNMQSHKDNTSFQDLFTLDERYDLWQATNISCYVMYGPSPLTDSKIPYSQSNLLNNIITSADKAIKGRENGASLRFGHEVCILPLACLMELNNSNKEVTNLDNLAKEWQNFNIYPMGANIQLIFYKNKKNNDILVKALLNEKEATLPVKTNMAPYYHWNDLRDYYLNKLNK